MMLMFVLTIIVLYIMVVQIQSTTQFWRRPPVFEVSSKNYYNNKNLMMLMFVLTIIVLYMVVQIQSTTQFWRRPPVFEISSLDHLTKAGGNLIRPDGNQPGLQIVL